MDAPQTPARPSLLMPLIWLVLALLGTLLAGVGVGAAAYGSESAGVTATMIAAFPVGLLWSGTLAGIVVHLTKKQQPALRIGAPLGCGLLGGVLLVALVFLFFVAIFPAL